MGEWSFILKIIISNFNFNVAKEKLTIFKYILKNLFIWNTVRLCINQERKKGKKKKCADNERRWLQTLFHVGMRRKQHYVEMYTTDANFEEGESVDDSREKESRYGNKIKVNRKTTSRACTNTMDVDINLEPGPGGRVRKSGRQCNRNSPKTSSK